MLKRKILVLAILAALPTLAGAQSAGPAYPRVITPSDSGFLGGHATVFSPFSDKASAAPRASQPSRAAASLVDHFDKGDGGFQPSMTGMTAQAPQASQPAQAATRHWDEYNP